MSDSTSLSELSKRIEEAKKQVVVGGKYSHFKNPEHTYKVIDIVIHEATEEPLVIYKPEYGNTDVVFARALSKWLENIEKDGQQIPRFTPVNVV